MVVIEHRTWCLKFLLILPRNIERMNMKIYSKNIRQPALGRVGAITHSLHGTELSLNLKLQSGTVLAERFSAGMSLMSISILLPLHDNLSWDRVNPGSCQETTVSAWSSTKFLRGSIQTWCQGHLSLPRLDTIVAWNTAFIMHWVVNFYPLHCARLHSHSNQITHISE